jgi:hypothetical protein
LAQRSRKFSANTVGKGNVHRQSLHLFMFIDNDGVQGLHGIRSAQPLRSIVEGLITDAAVCTELLNG